MSSASSMTPLPHLASFQDLLAIPEDERYHEILDGEIVQKAMAGGEHSATQVCTGAWMVNRFGRRPNGADRPGGWWFATEAEIELSRHQVVKPDVVGWRRERMPEGPRGYPMRLRPDWICEVMADSDARRRDGMKKRRLYADYGIPHYWLVDTERQRLIVLRLEAQGFVEVLEATHDARVRAEPFDAVELSVGVLFGDDPE